MGVGMNAQGTDALFPVIYLQVRDSASVDELRAMFDVLRAAGKRGTRHVTMTDSSTVKAMPDATIRRYVAEQQAEVEGLYGHLVIGSAVVVSGHRSRGSHRDQLDQADEGSTSLHHDARRCGGAVHSVAGGRAHRDSEPAARLSHAARCGPEHASLGASIGQGDQA